MKRQRYYPLRQGDQILWLENLRNKIGDYAAPLGLTPAQTDTLTADARWLIYVIGSWLPAVRAHGTAATSACRQAESGTGGDLALPVFTPPALPDGVAPRPEGSLARVFDIVQEIKEIDALTPAIASDLRITGAEEGAPDFNTLAPALTAAVSGGAVQIGWSWQGYRKFLDQCEIQVDRGEGSGWQILTFDTTPNYTDTTPHPAALTKWKYRAIYRVGDAQVGQWSPEASVVVGG